MIKRTQLSLFDQPTFNTIHPQKEAMNQAVRESGLSREQIVEKMNSLAVKYGVSLANGNNKELTIAIFEKWLNPADPSRQMPMRALPIFCAICGDPGPMEVLAMPTGFQIIGQEDQQLLKWARAYQKARAARQTMKRLEPDVITDEDL